MRPGTALVPRDHRGAKHLTGWLALAVVGSLTTLPGFAPAAEPLRCVMQAPARVPAGAPVPLRFAVTNRSAQALRLLEWNTPFEGWFGAYVEVTREGVPLPYRGPRLKRGDPSAGDYLRIGAGQTRRATVDLSLPFDLSLPGLFRVQPRITLHDVAGAAVKARSRAEHRAQPLPCNAVEVRVDPA